MKSAAGFRIPTLYGERRQVMFEMKCQINPQPYLFHSNRFSGRALKVAPTLSNSAFLAVLSARSADWRHASLKEITGPLFAFAIFCSRSDLNTIAMEYFLRHYSIVDGKRKWNSSIHEKKDMINRGQLSAEPQ
jgi:hypothetical protein